jgi:hypothetical protein
MKKMSTWDQTHPPCEWKCRYQLQKLMESDDYEVFPTVVL